MDWAFWQGRRVFLTGHTGFKGSWLSLWLQAMGAEVTGYSMDPPTTPALFDLAQVGVGMTDLRGDVRDLEALSAAMAQARPEVVLHLAAQALVRDSYAQPVETFATNVMGTVHLLEAARRLPGLRSVVCVTSDKCYENREWPWPYRENEAMGGFDPYSASKGCAELATGAWRRSFLNPARHREHGVAVASARAGNVLGGGDWAKDRLVPDILRAFEAGRAVEIRSPNALRPWQHVLEPLSGYLRLAQAMAEDGPRHADAWNFGPWESDAQPVRWLVERLATLWGEGASFVVDPAGVTVHEAGVLKLDISKARTHLGWTPRWHVAEGLRRVVDWHRAYLAGEDMRSVCLAQIADFEAAGEGR